MEISLPNWRLVVWGILNIAVLGSVVWIIYRLLKKRTLPRAKDL